VRKSQQQDGVAYSRVDLSHYHLYSAFFFMQNAALVEETASEVPNSDTVYRYRSYVMGAVFSSVAFLEAKIAEWYADAEDGRGISAKGLTASDRTALVAAFGALRSNTRMLGRYQVALKALRKKSFDADSPPYRPVALVIILRNYLVHFPGEWLAMSDADTRRLPQSDIPLIERQLKGQFPSATFAWADQPFFPDQCLSAGCARWAAESCLTFAQEFSTRTGTVMKHLRPTIGGV